MTKYLSFLLIFICFFEIYGQGIILRRVPLNRNVKDFHSIRLVPGFHFKATENRYFHAMIVKNPSEEHFHMPSKIIDDLINYNNSYSNNISVINFNIPNNTYVNKFCFQYDIAGNYTNFDECKYLKRKVNANYLLEKNEYEKLIHVYPNPTKGRINILWDKTMELKIVKIKLVSYDNSSNKNLTFLQKEYKTFYDISNYPKGIYFIHFFLENGKKVTKKIIKL